ncbi:carboxypeptidase regulatory-like domain-containing protein [Neolewinella persica]|uniref:carboxypeptidase regulatory-like domain-containing protein n=1 Tax=Neolewinella persica TaxID=70998 RepID=UPI000379BEEF|nr:carboxypeptidase regulatory-like domain-containing protein [Neolewinella persica]
MKNLLQFCFVLLLLAVAFPVNAQFRSEMRTANKEYELKAFNLAIESYKKALARRPSDVEALSRIADSYRMLNQMQTAHGYYQQATREKRVTKETLLEHAHVLKSLGRYDEAKQWYLLYARDHDAVVGNHFAQSCDFAIAQANADGGFTVRPISANSPVADFGPTMVTPTELVFNSARTAGGNFDGQAKNKPYVAAVGPDGSLQQAFELRTGYTEAAGNVGPVSYSPDGRQVIFTRNNFTTGTRMVPEAGISMNLMIADINAEQQWVNVRPLPFNGTDISSGFGTFSADGNTIYFSSNRPEGYGGYDIYRVNRQGQSWEAVPENLGTVVNSVGDEVTPFFDGASLFFSSNWHHGLGSYDVFRAEVVNGRPSTLYHMGSGINSERDDMGFVYDPVTSSGYMVSNRIGGNGQEDVYRVSRVNVNKILMVQSAQDGRVIANAAIDFTSCGGQVYATDTGGRYILQSTEGLNCEIVIGANGFQAVRVPLQSLQPDAQNIVRVSLNPASGPGGPLPDNTSPTPPGTYRGYVTDARTGYGVPQATVQIVQRTTGQSATLATSANGAYLMELAPYNTYDVSISAFGYETVRFPVTNNDGSDPNILGNMTLLPTGTPPVNNDGDISYTQLQGFSVQLASLAKQPDLSKFDNVKDLGRVYSVNAGSAYKVRLGVFATRAQAEAAAAEAKTDFAGAFVVADSGDSAFPVAGGGGGGYAPPTTNPVTPTNPGSFGRYKVQLGAFGKPENFDRNKAGQLGTVETTMRGTLTLFMIGNLNSLQEARSVQARAQSSGYSGAFVLESVNGQLVKVPN